MSVGEVGAKVPGVREEMLEPQRWQWQFAVRTGDRFKRQKLQNFPRANSQGGQILRLGKLDRNTPTLLMDSRKGRGERKAMRSGGDTE